MFLLLEKNFIQRSTHDTNRICVDNNLQICSIAAGRAETQFSTLLTVREEKHACARIVNAPPTALVLSCRACAPANDASHESTVN